MGFVSAKFPNRGLRFPKTAEKPPFQTFTEVERRAAQGRLSKEEESELWASVFLAPSELTELLEYVRTNSRHAFLYPMVLMAAHTGARRSELVRSQVDDIDFAGNAVVIRERKRAKGKQTFRRVPLSSLLKQTLQTWAGESSSRHTFHQSGEPLTVAEATHHLDYVLSESRYGRIRGWHVFRHSFISNCASRGVDQRIIDQWSGHQTEEMRRRYTHLLPSVQQLALQSVFGGC